MRGPFTPGSLFKKVLEEVYKECDSNWQSVASLTGVPDRTLRRIYRDETAWVSLDVADKIVIYTRFDLDEFEWFEHAWNWIRNLNDVRNVVPSIGGHCWIIENPGGDKKYSYFFETEQEAIDRATALLSRLGGGRLNVYGNDGKIKQSFRVEKRRQLRALEPLTN